jgi:lipoate-protein ligase A
VTAAAGGWHCERRQETAGTLHGPWPGQDRFGRRAVALCSVTRPALVLGSTQPDSTVDQARLAAASIELVRRGSGGGAVLVKPRGQVWLDAWIPRRDPLWDDDILRSSAWLGDAWAAALGSLGVTGVSVHRGRVVAAPWSPTICFAGIGPGEVSVDGRKLVGLSQRRTRSGARLHTTALVAWEPEPLVGLLALEEGERRQAVADTAAGAMGLADALPSSGDDMSIDVVERAVLEHLP